jgi:hypothetical protein
MTKGSDMIPFRASDASRRCQRWICATESMQLSIQVVHGYTASMAALLQMCHHDKRIRFAGILWRDPRMIKEWLMNSRLVVA